MKIQRREFLKNTAALAAMTSLPASVGAAPAMGVKSYRKFPIAPAARRAPDGLRPVKSRRNGPSNSQA
jgi:hypothetical protein